MAAVKGAELSAGDCARLTTPGRSCPSRTDRNVRAVSSGRPATPRCLGSAKPQGVDARNRLPERTWDDSLEQELGAGWGQVRGESKLEWDHARDDLLKLRVYIDANPFDTEAELIHQVH